MFEAFLLARLRPGPTDPLVASAVRAIGEARGQLRIRALARRLGISQDPFEKRFRRVVGASPKQLESLLRLRHAIESYRPGASLTRLAQEAGYFDQSHFSRELRAAPASLPAASCARESTGVDQVLRALHSRLRIVTENSSAVGMRPLPVSSIFPAGTVAGNARDLLPVPSRNRRQEPGAGAGPTSPVRR